MRGRFIVVSALGAVAGFGHFACPALLWLATRRRSDPAPPAEGAGPGLTAVVPAYRERHVIGRKLDELERLGYPGDVQIVVVADDAATAAAARRPTVELVEPQERLGKATALNRGAELARNPVLLLTDANTVLEPGTASALARRFRDPAVGAAAGEKSVAAQGEGLYWAFEAWLKRLESRTDGGTIGLVGELAAVRRDLYRPLPADVAVDDLWLALDVLEDGHRIVYEPAARAAEEASESWGGDWERRTRVVAGAIDVLVRRRAMLSPRRGAVAAQLWGHRLVRMTAGPLAHVALLALALGSLRRSRAARLFVALHAVAGAALIRQLRGGRLTAPERLAAQVLFLQLVALGGVARYLRRERLALWPKAAR